MGLSRALYAGISGLKGQQLKLDTIGNNIANVNTAGFKKSRVTFSDLFSDTMSEGNSPTEKTGGKNPSQIGLGAQATIEQIMTEGPSTSTGVATDLSIAGEGFFVVGDSTRSAFTRDGNFKLDTIGDLVMSTSNLRVKGWMANRSDTGEFVMDTSKPLGTINLQENRKQFAKATDLVTYSSNLDSSSTERNISQAETFVAYQDDSSTDVTKQGKQKISFSFNKIDANHYSWAASDSSGNTIANGELNFNDFGEILDSRVYAGGNTIVNYDFSDLNYQDIFATSPSGEIDPDKFYVNTPDNVRDFVMNPESADFLNLSKSAKPRAISFTYDPDGTFVPGSWRDPHGVSDLTGSSQNLSTAALSWTTGRPAAVADYAPSVFAIKNITINNSRENEKKGVTLNNYEGLYTAPPDLISDSGQIRVQILPDSGGDATKMNVLITKNYLSSTNPSTGFGAPEVTIGEVKGLSRSEIEHKISIPGLMDFVISKADAKLNNWADSPTTGGAGSDLYFNVNSSGTLNPIDDGSIFSGLPTGYHDGPKGPSKFELRNIDPSQSEYTGDLRVVFNAATSFQIIDDNNIVLAQGALKDGETDTEVEVKGIGFVIHREGIALTPKDLDENGFLGTEIKVSGFQAAQGKAQSVTVGIPKISDVNPKTGEVMQAETAVDFPIGYSKAIPSKRKSLPETNPGAGDGLASLNGTLPNATVSVDSSKALASAVGNYRLVFDVRSAPAGSSQYTPHNNPATLGGEDLNNQVLKVYVNGESNPRYIIDLNPQDDVTGATAPQVDSLGNQLLDSNFVPPYNFFAEMQNFDPALAPANISPTFVHQYNKVSRQIALPNGVIINLANISNQGRVGTEGATAYSGTSNFILGDTYNFDVTETGKAGLTNVATYSAAFQQGAMHSTSIEVFDSLGGSHILTTTFEHTDKNKSEWNYYLTLDSKDPLIQQFLFNPPAGFSVVDPKKPTDEELRKANQYVFSEGRQGKLVFKQDGSLDLFNSYMPKAKFSPADARDVEIKLDMNLITQFESEFGTAARDRTGNAMGLLEGFAIEKDGGLVGNFSNGQKVKIAQLAIATFNNPGGLVKSGSNTFESTTNSGLARIGTAGTDDRGLISSGVLEGSNVDLTEEFTELIVTQRSFTANGRIITTSDEFLQEILQLKR